MTTASTARSGRGRRSTRPSGDEREAAILATAERLLEDKKFADISVDDLAKGAGLSRPTFYFYFPSKDAVLLALVDPLIRQADTGILDYFFERYLRDAAACPIEFGDWVETVYDPAELHRTFHASRWANRLVDGALRRE